MTINIRYEACVRTLSLNASCTRCADTCPEHAIDTKGARGSVRVHRDRCTSCGLCQAECPTDAFETSFDVAAFLDSTPSGELRCGEGGLPCIGALSAEDLVTLALRQRTLIVHDGECASRGPGHAQALDRVEQARRFLGAVGMQFEIEWRAAEDLDPPSDVPPPPQVSGDEELVSGGRRRFLRSLVPAVSENGSLCEFPNRLDRAQMQQVTRRRRRMLAALPSSVEAKIDDLPESELGFLSSKEVVTELCTACSICSSVCPTGALNAPRSMREIRFDASRCTKCRLCHDVCEPDAIRLAERTSIRAFLDFSSRRLVQLPIAECAECGARFRVGPDGEGTCARCAELESELIELNGRKPS